MRTRNLLMLLASFLIAILLRLAINPTVVTEVEREFEAPLALTGLPEGLAVVQAPASVTLVARGTVTEVDRLETRTLRANASLTGAKPGTDRYAVSASAPVGSRVSLRPKNPTVTIEAETAISKRFTVDLITSGVIDPRYVLEGMSSEPATVSCSGPKSLMERVERVAATVALGKLDPGAQLELETLALDRTAKPVPGLMISPSKVTVTTVVLDTPQTRQLPVSIIYRGQLPPGFVLESATVTPSQAVVKGESVALSSMASVRTKPVELSTLKSSASYTVGLDLPDGVTSDTGVSYRVQIKVRRQRTESRAP